jgi:hypothetical protein
MASQPLRRALVKALGHRAKDRLGPQATPLDYVEYWLSSGHTLQDLSQDIAADLGRTLSRKFVSFVCNRLTADARLRIRVARTTRLQRPPPDNTAAQSSSTTPGRRLGARAEGVFSPPTEKRKPSGSYSSSSV